MIKRNDNVFDIRKYYKIVNNLLIHKLILIQYLTHGTFFFQYVFLHCQERSTQKSPIHNVVYVENSSDERFHCKWQVRNPSI